MKTKRLAGVISLGCDKNRIDSERALAILSRRFEITPRADYAELIVVNTCAFLESARKEAIDEILKCAELKKTGRLKKLIVSGCLPQKFSEDLFSALPEVDAFLGVSDYSELPDVVDRIYNGERVVCVSEPKEEDIKERVKTTGYHAYMRIADGCSNRCTYCLIPSIRGKYRSVKKESLIAEAKSLGEVAELILVAQDTTKYGSDLYEDYGISELIADLTALDNIKSVRLMYCYPENIDDKLIAQLKNNKKLIKYLDIPLQHADDKVLKRMNRKGSGAEYLELIGKLKREVEGIALRSTFIAGFPGESEEAYKNLKDFLSSAKLMNAGFFPFSDEEGTPAHLLDGKIDKATKKKRVKELYSLQKKIASATLKDFVGKKLEVLAEGFSEDTFTYYGRAYFNAPDVDGRVYFFSADEVEYGKPVTVLIKKADDFDLYGDRIL